MHFQFTAGCDPGKTVAVERVGGGAATAAGVVQATAELLLDAAVQPHAGTCRAAHLKGRDERPPTTALRICRQGGVSASWPL